MTLRELVHQAGGINSPQMDFEIRYSNPYLWTKVINHEQIKVVNESKAVIIVISNEDLAFLKELEI